MDFLFHTSVMNILTPIYFNSVLFLGWSILYFGIRYRLELLAEKERSENAFITPQGLKCINGPDT